MLVIMKTGVLWSIFLITSDGVFHEKSGHASIVQAGKRLCWLEKDKTK